jgi:hypothetical protein
VCNLLRRGGLGLVVVVLLAGCIQPVDTTETPSPGAPQVVVVPTPTDQGIPDGSSGQANPPPPTAPGQSWPVVDGFIRSRGDTPANLQVWYDQPRGPDQLQGFSYIGVGGEPCVGFLLTALVNGVMQPNNGGLLCAPQPGVNALAGVTFFATTDGQPYTVVVGRVEDPTITAISVIYSDNSNQPAAPYLGGFMVVKAGILDVNVITAINAEGNTVIQNIPQSPIG